MFHNRDDMRQFVNAGICPAEIAVFVNGSGVERGALRPAQAPWQLPALAVAHAVAATDDLAPAQRRALLLDFAPVLGLALYAPRALAPVTSTLTSTTALAALSAGEAYLVSVPRRAVAILCP